MFLVMWLSVLRMLLSVWLVVSCRLIVWLCDRLFVVVRIRLLRFVRFVKVFVWLLSVMLSCDILVRLCVISVVCVFSLRLRLLEMLVVIVSMFFIVLLILMLIMLLFV